MANHKSAKKRILQNATRNKRNTSFGAAVKTAIKKFRSSVGKESAAEEFKSAQLMLHRAAQKGLIHRNAASRRISRLSKLMKK